MTGWAEPWYCLVCDEPTSLCLCADGPARVYSDEAATITREMWAALLSRGGLTTEVGR